MIKRVTLIRRKAELDNAQFGKHWLTVHAPAAASFPGLAVYVQNHIVASSSVEDAGSFDVSGIAELWFDSKRIMEDWANAGREVMRADERVFLSGLTSQYSDDDAIRFTAGANRIIILATVSSSFNPQKLIKYFTSTVKAERRELHFENLTTAFSRPDLWAEPVRPNVMLTLQYFGQHEVGEAEALVVDVAKALRGQGLTKANAFCVEAKKIV